MEILVCPMEPERQGLGEEGPRSRQEAKLLASAGSASPEPSESRATEILIVAPWLFDNTFGPRAGAFGSEQKLLASSYYCKLS